MFFAPVVSRKTGGPPRGMAYGAVAFVGPGGRHKTGQKQTAKNAVSHQPIYRLPYWLEGNVFYVLAGSMVDDRIPHIKKCRCGRAPVELYGPTSTMSCASCCEEISIETAPFFRSPVRQLEHQTWRAVSAWNDKQAGESIER
jgi:hypothetical protein